MTQARRAATLAVAALALGLFSACTAADTTSPQGGPSSQETRAVAGPTPPPNSPTLPATGLRTRGAGLPDSDETTPQPSRLVIESADLDIAVVSVGVASDGQMELPPNPSILGWYRFGPGPADRRGAVVLGGHLDSKQYGAGPLVRLRRLQAGDLVTVKSAGGSTTQYRVDRVEDFPKRQLPISELFDRDGPRKLRIVTCGGPYDRNGAGYRDNLVVTASPA